MIRGLIWKKKGDNLYIYKYMVFLIAMWQYNDGIDL